MSRNIAKVEYRWLRGLAMSAVAAVLALALAVGAGVLLTELTMSPSWAELRKFAIYLALAGVVSAGARLHEFAQDRSAPEPAPGPDPLASVRNLRPVKVSITTPAWTKVQLTVTVDRLRTDFTLWRQMHFEDWDGIPRATREPALLAMIRAHNYALAGPAATCRAVSTSATLR